MNRRFFLVVAELLTYATTVALGLYVAWVNTVGDIPVLFEPVAATGENFLVFLGVFVTFTFIVVKFVRPGGFSLKVAMLLAIFIGAEIVFAAIIKDPSNISHVLAALAVIFLARLLPNVLMHNISIAIGIAGISAVLGQSITPAIAALLIAFLSIYDIFAVYKTRHMVAVAERMMTSGAVFGYLIPAEVRGFLWPWKQALDEDRVMMLGSGDVGLPLILAVAAVQTSLGSGIIVGAFALMGLMLTHWLFMSQRRRMPMAALPPVAAMSIIGYLVALLIGI